MDIKLYFNILIRRLWLIILMPIITVSVSLYMSYRDYIPLYVSSVTLFVINEQSDPNFSQAYSDILAGQQLVKEYKEIIKSRTVTKTVLSELGIKDVSAEELSSKISVTLKDETRILLINVQDTSSERAVLFANKISEVFKKKVVELVKVKNVEVIDGAEKAKAPLKTSYLKTLVIAVFGGIIVALGLIFVFEELDDTIKSVDDIEKSLDLKVLGTIPTLKLK